MPIASPVSIVITGASSGLGAALALAYAYPGVTLGLLGRNEERLRATQAACEAKGASVLAGTIDATDATRMKEWLTGFHMQHPVDLLIANAGIAAVGTVTGESEQQVRDVFSVNVGGVLNSTLPLIPLMQTRKRGQIALIASLAGIRGLPSCPAYSASKNAVRALGEGWRGSLKEYGIQVSVVCPGYIRTPMTAVNTFPMPFLMDADRAAAIIKKSLAANRGRIAFPLALYLPLWLLTCISNRITDPFFAALPKKAAKE
jgi:short-subunit dehydrogenase